MKGDNRHPMDIFNVNRSANALPTFKTGIFERRRREEWGSGDLKRKGDRGAWATSHLTHERNMEAQGRKASKVIQDISYRYHSIKLTCFNTLSKCVLIKTYVNVILSLI